MAYLIIHEERKRREAAVERARSNALFAKDILKRYSKSDTLNFGQVRAWLQVVANSQVGSRNLAAGNELESTFPGSVIALSELTVQATFSASTKSHVVSDDEVEWIFMMAMDKNVKGTFQRNVVDAGRSVKDLELQPKDFEYALRAWLSYIHNKPLLDEVMERYGTNASGQMERDSVCSMLTDLNGGVPPKESALEWVMAEARAMPLSPGISALELIKVMSLWYTKDLTSTPREFEEQRSFDPKEESAAPPGQPAEESCAAAGASDADQADGSRSKAAYEISRKDSERKASDTPAKVSPKGGCGSGICCIA